MNHTQTPNSPAPVDIARLRELEAKATPRPWKHVDEYADEPEHCVIQSGQPFYCMLAKFLIDDQDGEGPNEIADADFIAALRNADPDLLSEVELSREKVRAYKAALDAMTTLRDEEKSKHARSEEVVSKLLAERDKLREEVERLARDASSAFQRIRDIAGATDADPMPAETYVERVVAERDALRRENEELKAKLLINP